MKEYGHCLECKRLLLAKYLKRVKYWDGHMGVIGSFHHRLLCVTCEEKADEVFKDNKEA